MGSLAETICSDAELIFSVPPSTRSDRETINSEAGGMASAEDAARLEARESTLDGCGIVLSGCRSHRLSL
jgi:hypothetical protein